SIFKDVESIFVKTLNKCKNVLLHSQFNNSLEILHDVFPIYFCSIQDFRDNSIDVSETDKFIKNRVKYFFKKSVFRCEFCVWLIANKFELLDIEKQARFIESLADILRLTDLSRNICPDESNHLLITMINQILKINSTDGVTTSNKATLKELINKLQNHPDVASRYPLFNILISMQENALKFASCRELFKPIPPIVDNISFIDDFRDAEKSGVLYNSPDNDKNKKNNLIIDI
ncbi:MAG: hypothetical protein MHMPM18_005111, partial [Marteilia pararefringens]